MKHRVIIVAPSICLVIAGLASAAESQLAACSITSASLNEAQARSPEISTDALRGLLADGSVLLLDTRPHMEWSMSHIPGARNVAPKPGMPMSRYTSDAAEVERLVQGERARPLILYCNGPHCGKSKRLAEELATRGFTNVRRYQLGAPVWRALGGVMVIEPDGVRRVHADDRTAVWIDVRTAEQFSAGSIAGARNVPRAGVLAGKDVGEIKGAKDDGRLPMEDHNTRIIVFGNDGAEARVVAGDRARSVSQRDVLRRCRERSHRGRRRLARAFEQSQGDSHDFPARGAAGNDGYPEVLVAAHPAHRASACEA